MKKDNMKELKKEYDNIEVPPEVDFAIEKGIKKGKEYKRRRFTKPLGVIAAGLVLALGITSTGKLLSRNNTPIVSKKSEHLMALDYRKTLPTVGSPEKLEELLKTYIAENNGMERYGNGTRDGDLIDSVMLNKTESKTESSKHASSNPDMKSAQSKSTKELSDHSTTNLQVQGVDEEDLVKIDGEYIFKVNSGKIINVIKAEPASKMESINNIKFEDNYNISGIFLRENVLVVVGNKYQKIATQKGEQIKDFYKMPYNGVTKVTSFDISDKKNIVKVREIEIDGDYASSRMIGSRVYVIANKHLYNIGNLKADAENGKAYYSDSAVCKDKMSIDFKTISYLPDSIQPNYIMVASYNVDDNKGKVNVSTILGSGNSIYSSDKNLYIAGNKWSKDRVNNGTTSTIIYKFDYDKTGVKFVDKGEVKGTITNQFSMDEKDEYFRIATTEYKYSIVTPMIDEKSRVRSNGRTKSVAPSNQKNSKEPENQITNNLYILDKSMNEVGKLEGLANGEQIYSVRFMGDRAYIVTFMLTDPLFVIDLKNPTSPKVLGELKIPGFSNYLHPYDDTHLIGFGMDTTVINEGGMDRAKTKGMKIAIFDVSDVSRPVQQFMTTIGGVGTYSEVLNNHKALLFSKERNLLALPVTENNYDNNMNSSQQSYQGAYIYDIDLVNGIKLKGKITHMNKANNSDKNNAYSFNGQYLVDRILYIKDTLYTLSNGLIKANDINTLQEKSKLKLK